nr:restriction endonuclease [Campylobacter rectus]
MKFKNSSARSPQADQKGVFITTSKFSKEAQKYAANALAACLFVIYFALSFYV